MDYICFHFTLLSDLSSVIAEDVEKKYDYVRRSPPPLPGCCSSYCCCFRIFRIFCFWGIRKELPEVLGGRNLRGNGWVLVVASSTVSAQLLPFSKKLLFVRHGIRYLLLLLLLSGCFKFDTTGKMTQDAAVQYCQGVENATLIEIHNQEQKDFFVMERDVIEAEGGRKTCFFLFL